MSVAFNGIENLVVTFQAGTVAVGNPAAMSANNTVRNAISGTAPVGIVRNKRNDHAAVQVKGYAETKYSGSTAPSLGWNGGRRLRRPAGRLHRRDRPGLPGGQPEHHQQNHGPVPVRQAERKCETWHISLKP